MRIGHTGTGSTGKTTLAKELGEVLDLDYKPSVVREVFAQFGWTEENQRRATPAECWRLQEEIFNRKLYQDKHMGRDAIFDRTPIDHLAYCLFRCESILSEEQLKELEQRTQDEIRNYDIVIYHPIPSWPPEEDGLRETTYPYRVIIDNIILAYLHKMKVEYVIPPMLGIWEQRDSLYHFITSLSLLNQPPILDAAEPVVVLPQDRLVPTPTD